MKTKILAQIYALAVLLSPSLAWAQQTPVPVFPSNGDIITHSSKNIEAPTTSYCMNLDMTGYSDMAVIIYNSDAAVVPTQTCTSIGVETLSTVAGTPGSDGLFDCTAIVSGIYPVGARTNYSVALTTGGFGEFIVGGINRKVTVKVTYSVSSDAGAHCQGYVRLIPLAFPSVPAVTGIKAAGSASAYIYPVMMSGSDGTYMRTLKTNSSGNLDVVGTVTPSPGPQVTDIHATVAYQVNKTTATQVLSPVAADVLWRVRVQNLGNDELLIAAADPSEGSAHRVQAGGDVWEVDWKGDLYMKLISTAGTSPQVTPEDVRVTVMHY